MTRGVLHRLGAAGALVLLALVPAGPVAATTAPTTVAGDISDIKPSEKDITLVFGPTDGQTVIDPASVTVSLDGRQVAGSGAEVIRGGGAVTIERTVMLVVDTSSSMTKNNRLDGAKQAARSFLDTVPPDVRVGLLAFADEAQVVQEPTTDRASLASAVDSLTASGSTAIFDAVALAAERLGDTGARRVVLLTDGDESGSQVTLEAATAAVSGRSIRLDAVAFETKAGMPTLERLAAAGGGTAVTSEDAAQLAELFKEQGDLISRQLLVTAPLPPDAPRGQVTLTVTGTAGDVTVTDEAATLLGSPLPPKPTPAVDAAPRASDLAIAPLLRNDLVWVAVGLFFVGLSGVLLIAFNAAAPSDRKSVNKQLSVYTITRNTAKERRRESTVFGQSSIAQSAVELAGRLAARRGLEERLHHRLDAAAIPLKPAEWILIQAAMLLVLPTLAYLISGRNVMLTITGLVAAAVVPISVLTVKESRRRTKFADTLPDTLQLMAGSLTAGYSLPQAADSVVREGNDPMATEFNRALVETRLGVPIEDALEGIADRMRSKDWVWVVMAIRVQREVGGNLAELLITVAATLRDRARIRRQVRTLSAEGRLSAWILVGLPIVFTLYLLTARPTYILPLAQEPLGWLMIAVGVTAMVVGALWMKKIVDVEV